MHFLFLVLLFCLVESKDLGNPYSVNNKIDEDSYINEENVDLKTLLKKMNGFESVIASQDEKLKTMSQTIESQNQKIGNLKRQVEKLEKDNENQLQDFNILKQRVKFLEDNCNAMIINQSYGIGPEEKNSKTIHEGNNNNETRVYQRSTRAVQSNHVAFTAYLDHALTHMGIGQIIVFNQVLINDGNGYNRFTGIFTAPVTGTYFFTFTLHVHNFINAKLVKDGDTLVAVAARADFTPGSQDQSSNSVVVQLNAGQSVWAQSYNNADKTVDGYEEFRLVTFSGFLLY